MIVSDSSQINNGDNNLVNPFLGATTSSEPSSLSLIVSQSTGPGSSSSQTGVGDDSVHNSPSIKSSNESTPRINVSNRSMKNVSPSFIENYGDVINNLSENSSNVEVESVKSPVTATNSSARSSLLPWSSQSRSSIMATNTTNMDMLLSGDGTLRPGEIVMRTLFYDFTQQAEKKIESVMLESYVSLATLF